MNWFIENWAKLGFAIGVLVLIIILINLEHFTEMEFILRLQISFLMFHQFEEYVIPGGFKDYFNKEILSNSKKILLQLNETGILIINVAFGWMFYIFAAMTGDNLIWFSAGIILLTLINGVLHVVVSILKKKYNPGLITGLFLFIPLGIYFFISKWNDMNSVQIIYAALIALTGCVSIPVIIYLTGKLEMKNI